MDNIASMTAKFFADESAVTAIEYGLMASLVAIGALTGFSTLGDALFNQFQTWVALAMAVLVG